MSILIKGMDMPKDIEPGLVIEFADGIDGKRYARLWHYRHGGLTEWLEAVSIPSHGRLIDADVLTGKMEYNLWAIEDKAEKELGFDEAFRRGMQYGHAVCVDAVNDTPTIIPAEEGE